MRSGRNCSSGEEINIGEGEPRLTSSGLRPFVSEENLTAVLVPCNIKERKLAGFSETVRLVCIHVEARVSERVTGAAPFAENKIWKQILLQ